MADLSLSVQPKEKTLSSSAAPSPRFRSVEGYLKLNWLEVSQAGDPDLKNDPRTTDIKARVEKEFVRLFDPTGKGSATVETKNDRGSGREDSQQLVVNVFDSLGRLLGQVNASRKYTQPENPEGLAQPGPIALSVKTSRLVDIETQSAKFFTTNLERFQKGGEDLTRVTDRTFAAEIRKVLGVYKEIPVDILYNRDSSGLQVTLSVPPLGPELKPVSIGAVNYDSKSKKARIEIAPQYAETFLVKTEQAQMR